MSISSRAAAGFLLVAACGCQVEWGGGRVALENPAPPPDTTAAPEALEPTQLPLSAGPHLFIASLAPSGEARLVPVARVVEDADDLELAPVAFPDAEDPTYRARFDSAYLAPGSELQLLARGRRLGSIVVTGRVADGPAGCPSLGAGRAILVPGQDVPRIAFAVPAGASGPSEVARVPRVEETSSMGVAGPVLAERLIGQERGFLARRKSLTPVEVVGDTLAAMAATWLVADSLAPVPPGANAVSLFFLARFDPVQGFIPIWQEVRRYDDAADKEAFEFIDWIRLGAHRLDFVKRYDATSVTPAASITVDEEGPGIDWTDRVDCRTLDRLGLN